LHAPAIADSMHTRRAAAQEDGQMGRRELQKTYLANEKPLYK